MTAWMNLWVSSEQVDVRVSVGKVFLGCSFFDYQRELSYEVRQYLLFHPENERGPTGDRNQAGPIHSREVHSLMIWDFSA